MPNHPQLDEPQQSTIRMSIKITYPLAPIRDNDEYFEQRKAATFSLIEQLKEFGATDYTTQYCTIVEGGLRETPSHIFYDSSEQRLTLTPGYQEWSEIRQFVLTITAQIYSDLVEHKEALDILTDLATIFGVSIPLINAALKHFKKNDAKTVVKIGRNAIEIETSDLEGNKKAISELAERFQKAHPNAKPSKNVSINIKAPSSSHTRRSRRPNQKSKNRRHR